MSNRFTEEVVVRVWKNINNKVGLPTSHFGHAATSLRGSIVKPLIPNDDYIHISWWPGRGAGKNVADAFGYQSSAEGTNYRDDAGDELALKSKFNLEFYRLATTQNLGGTSAYNTMVGHEDFGGYIRELLTAHNKGVEPTEEQFQAACDEVFGEWIKADENGHMAGYSARTGQKHRGGAWIVSADEKIYIPGLGRAQETGNIAKQPKLGKSAVSVCHMRYFGLSTWRIAKWWEEFRQSDRYRLASKTHSCAGVAAVALKEGGGEAYQAKPSVAVWMAPNDVQQWAEQIAFRINELDRKANQFRQQMSMVLPPPFQNMLPHDLWPYDTWRRQSALRHKPRSGAIQAIGDALKKYHGVSWTDSAGFKEKLKQLVIVMDNATTHFLQKPNSERRVAVASIALQGIRVLNGERIKKP